MTDWIIIGGGIALVLVIAAVVAWKLTSADFLIDLLSAAADRVWHVAWPLVKAKVMARMPEGEEDDWNAFLRTNPDKYEIARWQRDYRRRKKAREADLKQPPSNG